MPGRPVLTWLLAGAVLLPSGCREMGALAYLFQPRQIRKAEAKLTTGRLALLVETGRAEEDNPVFRQTLQDRVGAILRENKVTATLVSEEEINALRQENPDFAQWSLQKIGRALRADQVLYVRVDRLQIRDLDEPLLLRPRVEMRLKLIDVQAPAAAAYVWPGPGEPGGRAVQRYRQFREGDDPVALDEETARLAKDAAWLIAQWFYDYDLENKTPWEI